MSDDQPLNYFNYYSFLAFNFILLYIYYYFHDLPLSH